MKVHDEITHPNSSRGNRLPVSINSLNCNRFNMIPQSFTILILADCFRPSMKSQKYSSGTLSPSGSSASVVLNIILCNLPHDLNTNAVCFNRLIGWSLSRMDKASKFLSLLCIESSNLSWASRLISFTLKNNHFNVDGNDVDRHNATASSKSFSRMSNCVKLGGNFSANTCRCLHVTNIQHFKSFAEVFAHCRECFPWFNFVGCGRENF